MIVNNEQNNDENKQDENEEEEILDDRKFSMIMNKGNKAFGMGIQEEKELFQEIENDNKQMLQNEDERDGIMMNNHTVEKQSDFVCFSLCLCLCQYVLI